MTCYELTGACLAVTRDGWRRVGRFDEGFRLYYEETEWLLRARSRGVRAVLAPAARWRTRLRPEREAGTAGPVVVRGVGGAFSAAAGRYGAWFAALLRRLERGAAAVRGGGGAWWRVGRR